MGDYEINEKDIDSILKYLKIFHPEDATPENAIAMLEEMQVGVHMMSHDDPEKLEKFYKIVKKNGSGANSKS